MKFITNLFKGRITRKTFILNYIYIILSIFLFSFLLYTITSFLSIPVNKITNSSIMEIIINTYGVIIGVYSLSLNVKRLHDLNLSGWFGVLLTGLTVVPSLVSPYSSQTQFFISLISLLVIIYLAAAKGTNKSNNYGPKPK